jgi:hypothetical protein
MVSSGRWNLFGPVHTLRAEFTEWDVGREQWQAPRHVSVVQFRHDGSVSQLEYHNPNGSISTSKYIYNNAGLLMEVQSQLNDGPVTKTTHRYDDVGRLIRSTGIDANNMERVYEVYDYDNAGRKTKRQFVAKPPGVSGGTMYGVEGSEQPYAAEGVATITTAYDDHDRPVEALFHDADQRLVLRVTLARDTAGQLASEQAYLGERLTFSSGDQPPQNMPAEDQAAFAAMFDPLFDPRNMMSSIKYRYDGRGRRIERLRNLWGMGEKRTSWYYDEHDNPTRQIDEDTSREMRLDESGNLQPENEKSFKSEVRFDYQYDSQRNWTERVVWVLRERNPDFQRSNIERRQITYYL